MSSLHPMSDNEDESPILYLGTFMGMPVASAQNPMIPDVPYIQNSATPPEVSGPNLITIRSHPTDWQSIVSGIADQAHAPDQSPAKSAVVDYQSLGPFYSTDDVTKNKHQLDMKDVPNAILQMAYNKIYVLLSMLMTSALSKIHGNDNLKYRKVPFGNGSGKQSLNESSFPQEDSLSETMFFQAYRNWLTIIDMIAMPEAAVGWYEHHSRMLHDK